MGLRDLLRVKGQGVGGADNPLGVANLKTAGEGGARFGIKGFRVQGLGVGGSDNLFGVANFKIASEGREV